MSTEHVVMTTTTVGKFGHHLVDRLFAVTRPRGDPWPKRVLRDTLSAGTFKTRNKDVARNYVTGNGMALPSSFDTPRCGDYHLLNFDGHGAEAELTTGIRGGDPVPVAS